MALATGAFAANNMMNVFSDDFEEIGVFAERWMVDDPTVLKSEGGRVIFNGRAMMTLRRSVPNDAVASGRIVLKSGTADLKVEDGKVVFHANGEGTLDDVSVEVPVDANASPNLIINSGFEYDNDGVPLHYCNRSSFNWAQGTLESYEQEYLTAFVCDTSEKRSGRQSLRVRLSPAINRMNFYPHDTLTAAGRQGVFSAWMKTSVAGTEVTMFVQGGERTSFKVGTDWARYEVASTNLPGRGLFSPIGFNFPDASKQNAYVWIDDIQFEFAGDDLEATTYRPSDLDIPRFVENRGRSRPEPVILKKLPADIKPSVEIEKWIAYATESTPFLDRLKQPFRETRAWLACDDDNLYIAFRNFGESQHLMKRERGRHDDTSICTRDSVEIGLQPTREARHYHIFAASNGDRADSYTENFQWDGAWSCEARAVDGAVEYFLTFSLADFVEYGFTGRWAVNLMRNDRHDEHQGCYSTSLSESGRFRDTDAWGELVFPADIAAKWTSEAAAHVPPREVKVLGRLDYYMNEPVARFRVWDEHGKIEEVAMDIAEMACGTNAVVVKAHGREFPAEVVKLPHKQGATQVNFWTRSLIHDGEILLPIANCLIVRENPKHRDTGRYAMIDAMKARGFQYVHLCSFSQRSIVETTAEMIRQSRDSGMRVMNWTDDRDGQDIGRSETFDLTDSDNIITQIVTDEPDLRLPSDVTRDFLLENKRRFPYTPVQMNNSIFGIASRYADLETDILMLDDYLTNNEGRTVEGVVRQVDVMLSVDDRKPAWYFLAGENSMHYRVPSYAEQIAQCWGVLCSGGSGVTWFVNMPTALPTWKAMIDFNREAQQVKNELLSEEICGQAICSESWETLRFVTRKVGDAWYVFSVNVDASPVEKATFTLPEEAPQNGKVEVLFENRTLELKDGVFSDAYPAHFRHLYKITK